MNTKHLTQLVTNQQPAFGQFAGVDNVNYLDAFITTPDGKALSHAEKKRKANQFCFIGIQHERYIIGCAVVNLKALSNCFVYVYDKHTSTMQEISKISPLALRTKLPTTPNVGKIQFKQAGLNVLMDFAENAIKLSVKSKLTNINAVITPSQQPMCLCTRTGYTGWVYMQKQTALSCTGSIQVNGTQTILTQANCRAGIDWTLGYMTRETFWNWASINTHLTNLNSQPNNNSNSTLGLNLVCGVNDTSFTENAVWLDDTLYNMPLTIFEYDQTDIMQPWHIYSNTQIPSDRKLDLTFTPKAIRDEHTDAKIMASHFSQLMGTYSGSITLPNETIELDNVWGLAEDHYAKW